MASVTNRIRRNGGRQVLTLFLTLLLTVKLAFGWAFAALTPDAKLTRQKDIEVLHLAASEEVPNRPDQAEVLQSVLRLQRSRDMLNRENSFMEELTGKRKRGGKRWRLVYLATKDAVVATRKKQPPPSWLDRGWYVDGFVTAVQRFENSDSKRINQNGVFELLGLGGFFFGYFARFKWPAPEKRTTMAFQPVTQNVRALGIDWSTPFEAGFPSGSVGDNQFDSARLQELNIFNFLYVDEQVAVAQGASGSVALWGQTTEVWDANHLIEVPEAADAR